MWFDAEKRGEPGEPGEPPADCCRYGHKHKHKHKHTHSSRPLCGG